MTKLINYHRKLRTYIMKRAKTLLFIVLYIVFISSYAEASDEKNISSINNSIKITDKTMFRQPWPGEGRESFALMDRLSDTIPLNFSTLTLIPEMKIIGFQWPDKQRLLLEWDRVGWNILKGDLDKLQIIGKITEVNPVLVFYGNGIILCKEDKELAGVFLGNRCIDVKLIVHNDIKEFPEFETFDIFQFALQWNLLKEAEKNLAYSQKILSENKEYVDASWNRRNGAETTKRFSSLLDLLDISIKEKRRELSNKTKGWLPIVMNNCFVNDKYNTLVNFMKETLTDFRYFGDYFGKNWTILIGMPEYQLSLTLRTKTQRLCERAWRVENVALKKGVPIKENNNLLFAAGFTNSLSVVPKNKPFVGEFMKSYSLELAKGEYESFQLVLTHAGNLVENVSLEIKGNSQIPKDNFQLYNLMYYRLKESCTINIPPDGGGDEYCPDILQPISEDETFSISPNSNTTLWITVQAPKSIKAGIQKFSIIVKKDGNILAELPLSMNIFDFAIGKNRLMSAAGMRYGSLSSFCGKQDIKTCRKNYGKMLLKHYLNPIDIYGLSPKFEDVSFFMDNGMTAAMMPTYQNLAKPKADMPKFIKLYASADNKIFKLIEAQVELVPQGDPDTTDWDIVITPKTSLRQFKAVKIHYADTVSHGPLQLNTTRQFLLATGSNGENIEAQNIKFQINDKTPISQEDAKFIVPEKSFDLDSGFCSIVFAKQTGNDIGSIRLINSRRTDWIDKMKEVSSKFRSVGGNKLMLLSYGYDESSVWENPELFESLRLCKKMFPDVKTVTTSNGIIEMPECYEFLDYKCTNNTYYYLQREREICEKTGTQLWTYLGGGGYYPFASFERVDQPRINSRAFFWLHCRFNFNGWLYFAINMWRHNQGVPRQWPEIWDHWDTSWSNITNGMSALVYPGPNGTPLPSARLEAMRDGIEDYNYFAIAEEMLKTRKFNNIGEKNEIETFVEEAKKQLSFGFTGFLQDYSKMTQIRSKLGHYIEVMAKLSEN